MGGQIQIESELGKGSVFSVHLTLAVATEAVPSATQKRAFREGASAGLLKILLADDNRVNQKVAARILEKQGHQVRIAENGVAAVEEFQRGDFDLILMDVQMPEMDGLDATREIQRLERNGQERIPIIAMTAQTMRGDRDNCFAAGMDGFVSKPIDLAELQAAIEAARPAVASQA
jgi:CheY-like chemotaxis protein